MAVHEAKDKVFIITGGAIGIGALTVRAILEENAKHVAIVNINEDAGKLLEVELVQKYGAKKVKFIKCDLTDDCQLMAVYDAVIKSNGYIDVVINNAGILNDSENIYRQQIKLNVLALVTSTMKAMELMRKDNGGHGGTIINISSVLGLMQNHMLPIYSATKTAVLQFSNCMGMEPTYSRTGVRVIAVCFGGTQTSLLSRQKYASWDKQTDIDLQQAMEQATHQKAESAVKALLEVFKRGASASTWLAEDNRDAEDITQDITEGFAKFGKRINKL